MINHSVTNAEWPYLIPPQNIALSAEQRLASLIKLSNIRQHDLTIASTSTRQKAASDAIVILAGSPDAAS